MCVFVLAWRDMKGVEGPLLFPPSSFQPVGIGAASQGDNDLTGWTPRLGANKDSSFSLSFSLSLREQILSKKRKTLLLQETILLHKHLY